jgi:CheY-like chemotaxis protein
MPPLPPILVADDDPDDLFFTKRILLKAGLKNPLVALHDGEEVISFLKSADQKTAGADAPCLLVLDIKMPRCGGFEVLEWARRQKSWRDLKVVILSGSDEPRDRKRASDLGANGYLVKPAEADNLGQFVAAANATGRS